MFLNFYPKREKKKFYIFSCCAVRLWITFTRKLFAPLAVDFHPQQIAELTSFSSLFSSPKTCRVDFHPLALVGSLLISTPLFLQPCWFPTPNKSSRSWFTPQTNPLAVDFQPPTNCWIDLLFLTLLFTKGLSCWFSTLLRTDQFEEMMTDLYEVSSWPLFSKETFRSWTRSLGTCKVEIFKYI